MLVSIQLIVNLVIVVESIEVIKIRKEQKTKLVVAINTIFSS